MKRTFLKILILFSYTHTLICMEGKLCSLHPRTIVYAPWRATPAYPKLKNDSLPCRLCALAHEKNDEKALILHRGNYNFIVINSNPYIYRGIHVMIIPYFHEKHLYKIPEDARKEAIKFSRILHQYFSERCYEIDSNYNIGKNACASIAEHAHQHFLCNYNPRCCNLIEAIEQNQTYIINQKLRYKIIKKLSRKYMQTNTLPLTPTQKSSCYYCEKLQENTHGKNLIIHEGKHSSIMFDHNPFCYGHLSIIPHEHYEQQEHIPYDILHEMNNLAVKIYPILLSLLHIDDINIGMTSYGTKNSQKDHIKLQLVPRESAPSLSPTLNKHYINENILELYEKLVKKFKKKERNKN